jgi:adenylate cyclase
MRLELFWSELKRRRVVRLIIVYMVGAWVVIEVASTIFPPLDIPGWALSLLIVLVILGFPVSLTLAWAFDVTSEGLRRTEPLGALAVGAGDLAVAPAPWSAASPGAGVATGVPGSAPSTAFPGSHEVRPAVHAPASPAVSVAPVPEEKSIAVLPFVNMSDERENEYFSDGMTEELLNALVRVRELQVASRTSSFALKGKDLDIQEVGERLRVAHVLEGSVRKAGDRIRITAQLIDARNGFHLWSEVYDRELKDVFQVQDEIARAIVDALKVQFGGGESQDLVAHATDSLEAYTRYLKGRFHYNKFTEDELRLSIQLYREALKEDPGYARALAGIADSWMNLADDWVAPNEAYPKAKEAALKALAIEPGLAEANTALGKVLGWYDWEFDAAELALRRAVASNPKYAEAHWALGSLLPTNGRLDEAIAEMRTGLSFDPLSAMLSAWAARFLLYDRRYDEALEQCDHALSLDPRHTRAHLVRGQCHLAQGDPDAALDAFRRGAELGDIAYFDAFAATALIAAGREAEARDLLDRIGGGSDERYVRPEALAMVHGFLGETDRAMHLLEEAIAARSAGLIYLHVDPSYDPLRADPRFPELVQRVGLRGR